MRLEGTDVDGREDRSTQAHQRLKDACGTSQSRFSKSTSSRDKVCHHDAAALQQLIPGKFKCRICQHNASNVALLVHGTIVCVLTVATSRNLGPHRTYHNAALPRKGPDVGSQARSVGPAAARKCDDGEAHHLQDDGAQSLPAQKTRRSWWTWLSTWRVQRTCCGEL